MDLADLKRRRAENVPGRFFVDSTCIDCDTCRWMAPETYTAAGGMSAVHQQPEDPLAERRALHALLACPTGSIGTVPTHPELRAARDDFPLPVHGPVFHCGFHASSSFGAASYFLQREDGNVLIDSPRYVTSLAERIEALGGIRWLYLTHRDDVADHARWAERFGCERVLHRDDVTRATEEVEVQPEGPEPLRLADGLTVVPVPGHTKGHTVLHVDDTYLFTGDHLAWSDRRDDLVAFRGACWYDWEEQVRSMERLLDCRFSWVLPGHGRRHGDDPDRMRASLERCIAWMRTVA